MVAGQHFWMGLHKCSKFRVGEDMIKGTTTILNTIGEGKLKGEDPRLTSIIMIGQVCILEDNQQAPHMLTPNILL